MVTDRFFDTPLGKIIPSHISGNDDGTKVMNGYGVMQRLGDMTGRDFINFVFRTAFEAMGGREEYFVVLVTGRRGKEEVLKEVRLGEERRGDWVRSETASSGEERNCEIGR